MVDAVDHGPGIIVIVAGEQNGNVILLAQRLDIVLNTCIIFMTSTSRPSRFMEIDEFPGLNCGIKIAFDPNKLQGTRTIIYILIYNDKMRGPIVKRPVPVSLKRIRKIFNKQHTGFLVITHACLVRHIGKHCLYILEGRIKELIIPIILNITIADKISH